MSRPKFEIVPTPITPLSAPPRPRRAGAVVSALLVLGALGAVAYTGNRQLDALLSTLDEETLGEAGRALESLLARQKDQLAAEVTVLADDNRIRATVLAPEFDAPTVQDVIEDLRKSSGATLLAVLDANGKVQVVTGAGALKEANLGASPTVKAAFGKSTSDVWTLPDQVQVIGLAPIRSGDQTPALLVKGLPLGGSQLATVASMLGVAGAVSIGDKLIATSATGLDGRAVPGADAALDEALKLASGLPEGVDRVTTARGSYLVKVIRTGPAATAARVAWLVPYHHQIDKTRLLRLLVWAPLALGALLFLLLLATSQRNHGGST
jgi:hypothetical protein